VPSEEDLRQSANDRMGRETVDPEETLRRMRELAAKLVDCNILVTEVEERAAGEELAELTIAMDGWLSKGGFPPKDWSR
jgi:hypothetical protein